MSVVEEALGAHLLLCSGLTALIGTRVYLNRIPQKATLPCLTYQRISTPREATHGTLGIPGTASPRFQFDAHALTYVEAKAITDQLRAALSGFRGMISGVDIQSVFIEDERINSNPELAIEDIQSDYIIWHKE